MMANYFNLFKKSDNPRWTKFGALKPQGWSGRRFADWHQNEMGKHPEDSKKYKYHQSQWKRQMKREGADTDLRWSFQFNFDILKAKVKKPGSRGGHIKGYDKKGNPIYYGHADKHVKHLSKKYKNSAEMGKILSKLSKGAIEELSKKFDGDKKSAVAMINKYLDGEGFTAKARKDFKTITVDIYNITLGQLLRNYKKPASKVLNKKGKVLKKEKTSTKTISVSEIKSTFKNINKLPQSKQLSLIDSARDEINKKYFNGKLKKANTRFLKDMGKNRNRLGQCSANGEIGLAPRLMMASPSTIYQVLVHEICHHAVFQNSKRYRGNPHGSEWQSYMTQCKVPPNRCATREESNELLTKDELKERTDNRKKREERRATEKSASYGIHTSFMKGKVHPVKFMDKGEWAFGYACTYSNKSRNRVAVITKPFFTGSWWNVPTASLYEVDKKEKKEKLDSYGQSSWENTGEKIKEHVKRKRDARSSRGKWGIFMLVRPEGGIFLEEADVELTGDEWEYLYLSKDDVKKSVNLFKFDFDLNKSRTKGAKDKKKRKEGRGYGKEAGALKGAYLE